MDLDTSIITITGDGTLGLQVAHIFNHKHHNHIIGDRTTAPQERITSFLQYLHARENRGRISPGSFAFLTYYSLRNEKVFDVKYGVVYHNGEVTTIPKIITGGVFSQNAHFSTFCKSYSLLTDTSPNLIPFLDV